VLALDNYEVFRLMDTWMRQVFMPALGDNVRLLLVSREPPSSAWVTGREMARIVPEALPRTEKLTDAIVAVEGENMRQVTWVAIEDVKSGEWGIGGKALTTEAVKALAAGR